MTKPTVLSVGFVMGSYEPLVEAPGIEPGSESVRKWLLRV